MFNWDDKNFYKLLTENYHEEGFRACDMIDCVEYQSTMRKIIKMQKHMMDKYPDAIDDLNNLGDLYLTINEVKDHYFFEEGVMFAMNLLLPRMLAREFAKMDRHIIEKLERPAYGDDEDLEDDFDFEDEDEDEEEET